MDSPMRRALELAWEAYRSGSLPVGAVLIDRHGVHVAEGRNRIGEADGPPGRMRSTAIAHAEIDVLAQLPPGDRSDHQLFTSLEPCLLCRSAIAMVGVGTVHHLGSDPACVGLDRLPTIAHHARRDPVIHGPGEGPAAFFASVLPAAVLFAFAPGSDTIDIYRRDAPELAEAAQRIVTDDLWPSRRLTLDEAIDAVAELA